MPLEIAYAGAVFLAIALMASWLERHARESPSGPRLLTLLLYGYAASILLAPVFDVDQRDFAEYFLIGTLLSVLVSGGIAVSIKALLR